MKEKKFTYLSKKEMEKTKGGYLSGPYTCHYKSSMDCIVYIDDFTYPQYLNTSLCNGCTVKRIETGGGGGGGPIDNEGAT